MYVWVVFVDIYEGGGESYDRRGGSSVQYLYRYVPTAGGGGALSSSSFIGALEEWE